MIELRIAGARVDFGYVLVGPADGELRVLPSLQEARLRTEAKLVLSPARS